MSVSGRHISRTAQIAGQTLGILAQRWSNKRWINAGPKCLTLMQRLDNFLSHLYFCCLWSDLISVHCLLPTARIYTSRTSSLGLYYWKQSRHYWFRYINLSHIAGYDILSNCLDWIYNDNVNCSEHPPSKHETLTHCWVDVCSPSTSTAQHQPDIGSMSRVCWAIYFFSFSLTLRYEFIPLFAAKTKWKWDDL